MFLVNLFLAVIFDEFMRAQATDEAEKEVTAGAGKTGQEDFDVDEGATAMLIGVAQKAAKAKPQGPHPCDCMPVRGGCCGWRAAIKDCMLSDTLSAWPLGLPPPTVPSALPPGSATSAT